MKRSKVILYFALFAAAFSLVLGIVLNQEYVRILIPLSLGAGWLVSIYRKSTWGPTICAFGLLLFASILHNVSEIWLYICLLGCFVAWDLSYFLLDMQLAELLRREKSIENDHLVRLALIVGLSTIVLFISKGLSIDLSFGGVLILGLVLIFGFSRAIILIRESSPDE